MSSAQINAAREDGRLTELLTGTTPAPPPEAPPEAEATTFTSPGAHRTGEGKHGVIGGGVGRGQLAGMSYDEINTARSEGRLNDLLGRSR